MRLKVHVITNKDVLIKSFTSLIRSGIPPRFNAPTYSIALQEFIDMCDYAVGLSRQLSGSIIPSEREHPGVPQFCMYTA